MKTICPGQDTRFWKPEDIFELACSRCGKEVEFFKDDTYRRCRGCGQRMENPKLTFGCAQWCEHAKDCLGYDPKKVDPSVQKDESLLNRLIESVKESFGPDQTRLTRTLTVLEFAEDLLRGSGISPRVVLASAVLHDLGGGNASCQTGPDGEVSPVQAVLQEHAFPLKDVDEICAILANFEEGVLDSEALHLLRDADHLADLREEMESQGRGWPIEKINRTFSSQKGKDVARWLSQRNKEE